MLKQMVVVDFKMRRERRPEPAKSDQFWVAVQATPLSPQVQEIRIDMYQTDSGPDALRTYLGIALTPYPMENGEVYTWDFALGDVVVVIVRYTMAEDHLRWLVAASGVWMSDGSYFMRGKTLKDRSGLFA